MIHFDPGCDENDSPASSKRHEDGRDVGQVGRGEARTPRLQGIFRKPRYISTITIPAVTRDQSVQFVKLLHKKLEMSVRIMKSDWDIGIMAG